MLLACLTKALQDKTRKDYKNLGSFQKIYMKKYLLVVTLLLSGCGFHLRGMVGESSWLKNVIVVNNSVGHDLETALNSLLQSYNIELAHHARHANFLILLEFDEFAKQITNVSASTAPRQYQITYTVQFNVSTQNAKIIVPTTKIVITRYLTINNDRILGSISEEAKFKNEMQREAALQIIEKISRTNNKAANLNVN